MSIANIERTFAKADDVDIREGKAAYVNYHDLLKRVSSHYGLGFVQTVAAFASLSPNNDYIGNLRSLVTLAAGIRGGDALENITTSTYRHCLERAYRYIRGDNDFLLDTDGPKIRNFYCNIVHPEDPRFVTIDGHIHNVWAGRQRTMKDALIKPNQYSRIADDLRKVARKHRLIPNQLQAILWFTWKQTHMIKYCPQVSLFCDPSDYWGLKLKVEDIKPF